MFTGLRKRKRDEEEDSDHEEPSFGKQILPVANLPGNYDGIPQDGMEYLFTVRRDALRLPRITRVDNPYAKPETKPTLSLPPPTLPAHYVLPSEEWCNLIETRFQNLRKNLSQPTIHVEVPQSGSTKVIPDIKERALWWEFLAGKPTSDWNPSKKTKNTKQRKLGRGMRAFTPEAEPEGVRDAIETTTSQFNEGREPETSTISYQCKRPTPRILKRLDESMSLHLLMYFTHWINVQLQGQPSGPSGSPLPRLSQVHAQWIFALLTRIGDFISADDMSLLRNLSRACFSLLKVLIREKEGLQTGSATVSPQKIIGEDSEMDETSCWVIIAIIVGVWKQRDLWTDADALLRSIP
ncbi:hypothetical protein E1B28_004169 [Marasmius oreades]|uniref:Gem-associated protein 2 n=1 Tax=Marasmius oreades TaxID=181124 RepID=A0A9P7UY41_9AGAR|nr:uncharacterized protein E1B28_004169 [Marasmius oreades]KAG7096757.1 hypothetical protein E1B28_004169 [Marasmius oreades]